MYPEGAAHIRGLSNFEEICNGPARPYLQSSGVCASVHDWHRRPPALQLLRLNVAQCGPSFTFLTLPHVLAALETSGTRVADIDGHYYKV
jgi:hypothetical protein